MGQLIVQKYGGSSVANADRILHVANLVAQTRAAGDDIVVVVSAMGDTTDELISLARQVCRRPTDREMDLLLSRPEDAGAVPAQPGLSSERLRQSTEARRNNLERLKRVRGRTYQDLMITLSWVRELVSMIHLAKFTGAPASRAEELVA